MKKCRKIQMELSAYIDDELPPTARALVEEHVQGCAVCQERLAELKGLTIGVMSLPRLQPAPAFLAGVHRKIAQGTKSQARAWQDYLFRPVWLKIPLEAVAAIAIVLLVMRMERSVTERLPLSDKAAAPAAKPASTKIVAGGEPRSTNRLAPNRLVGSAAPWQAEPAANLVVVHEKDFVAVQNRVQQLAASMNGRIVPPPHGETPAHVLFVELPPENVEAFKSRLLQAAEQTKPMAKGQVAAESAATGAVAGGVEKKAGLVVLEIQVVPPTD